MINKRVKKWAAQSVVGCLLVSTFFGFGASVMAQDTKDAAANGYKDLNDSYAVKEIQTLSEMGILSGFDGGFFKPHDAVTRAQLAKILVMSMGLKEDASSAAGFTDVPQDAWYRGFVGALVKSGVTQGTDANQFSPEKTVTREELATFFIRSFGLEGQASQSGTDAKLSDMSSVSDWAKADVAFAFKIGFIGGIDDGKGGVKFQPKDTAERQALARLGYEFKLNNAKYMSKAEELNKAGSGTNSGSTGSTGKDNAETTSVVSDLVATTNTTMEVIFKAPVDAVSTTDFQFDNDLTVSAASIKSSMPNVVQLTTSAQTAGQVYNLTYKGKQTGIKATGVAVRTGGSSSLPFNPSDPFAFAGTYESDFNITSSGTYGPINGTSVINGTLTLDPGPSGEITLRNVKVSNLEVKSGAANSIHFVNVLVTGAVNINATGQDNPVHVVTEGTTSFGDLNVISPSTLDLMSSGTIGSITVNPQAAGTTLQLGTGNNVQSLNVLGNLTLNGDFSQVLVSKDRNASIATTDASAQSLLDQLLSNIKDAAQAAMELKNKLSSNELTADFDLPVLNASQAALQWTSSSDALKIIDGVHVKVTRGETDTTVTLTVKITIGKAVQEISFTFKVKGLPGQPGMTDEQKAQADKDALNLGDLSAVMTNLTLPATGANGSVITWATSNAGVVTVAGVVTLPSSGQPDAQAVLTATITSNGYSTTKTFNITVKSLTALVKGFVYNDKHEPLSGVSVTLGTYTVVTGSQGEYVISNIQPGSYSLKVELSGYESYNGEAVTLAAGQTWNVSDIILVYSNGQPSTAISITGLPSNPLPTRLINTLNRTQADLNASLEQSIAGIVPMQVNFDHYQEPYSFRAASDRNSDTQLWTKNNNGDWIELNHLAANDFVTVPVTGSTVHQNIYVFSDEAGTYQLHFDFKKGTADVGQKDTSVTFNTPSGLVNVQLLGFNDLHGKIDQTYPFVNTDINGDGKYVLNGNYGRMDYFATYLKQRQATNPNTILIHEGDAVGGSSPVSALNKEEPTVDILNTLGFDVGTVGNHEFDKGVDEMLRLINAGEPKGTPDYLGMGFPLVAANVSYKDTGKPVLPPYFIQKVGGVQIGFIGVVTTSAAGMVMPAGISSIQFTDETAAVNKYVPELKAKGVKAIVVLAHMDATMDNKGNITGPAADLAKNVDDEVDVILGAHSHKLANGMVKTKSGKDILVTQAYEYGKAMLDIDLAVDPTTGDIVDKKAEIVFIDQSKVSPDPQVAQTIKKFSDLIAPKLNEVEGYASVTMAGGYASYEDNALGNLIADSMRNEMGTDFAMMNGGGIRQDLQAGPITWESLFNILPFNNILQKVEIQGSDLAPILNAQISSQYGSDFSISGFSYTWDKSTFKVTDIKLKDGSPIDPNKTYTLTVNNFMYTATGAKYVEMGKRGKNPVIGPEDLPALVNYVKSFGNQPIAYPATEGRIKTVEGGSGGNTPVYSIAEIRGKADNTDAATSGIVISKSDSTNSFYLQDGTGGIYIFRPTTQTAVDVGDQVTISFSTKTTYNAEIELKNAVFKKTGTITPPAPIVIPASEVANKGGQLVTVKNLKVSSLSGSTFNGTDANGVVLKIYGTKYGVTFPTLKNGDVVDVTGISTLLNTTIEIAPRNASEVIISNQQGMTDQQKAQADTDALNLGDLSAVTSDLTLPTSGANGSVITWATNNAAAVTTAGTVTRPAIGQPDANAVLTATVTSNTYSTNRTFDVIVKAQTANGLTLAEVRSKAESAVVATSGVVTTKGDTSNTFYMQDATGGVLVYSPTTKTAVVPGDQVAISSGVKTTYNGEIELTGAVFIIIGHTDVPAPQVVAATEVPAKGGQLVTVKHLIVSNLSGSNFDATDLDGNLIKIYGQKYKVNYNGAIANGDIVDATGVSVMFNSTVEIYPLSAADIVKQGKVSDADKVQLDKSTLNLGDVSAVYADLLLPTVGNNGSAITWTTSNTSILTAAGQVKQPAYGEPDQTVTLTANLNLNGNLASKTFVVTVKAQAISDTQAVANEAAVLYVFYDGVEENVVLADRGVDGTKVTWQLADAAQASIVNIANGKIVRSALTTDTQVALNATITRGNKSAVKSFTITVNAVKEQPNVNPVTINDSVVTGTAKAGTTVTVSTAGKTLGSGAAAAGTGDFSVTIAPQTAGTLLEISASGSGYTSDSNYMLVTEKASNDPSGATLNVSPNTPAAGESFTLSILNAKGQDGNALNGSIAISVSSSVYGNVYSAPVQFIAGSASVKLTLNQVGTHKLTVAIPGVTVSPIVDVTVSQATGPLTIANGGFESWTAGKPDAWMAAGTNISAGSVYQTVDSHSGSYAVRLENNGSSHERFVSQAIPLVQGKTYVITYYAKGNAQVRNGNVLVNGTTTSVDPIYSKYHVLTSTWEKFYDYEFTPKTSGDYGIIFSVLKVDNNNKEVFIDDVTISVKP
ncbi:immunoglobulin-like domain-containing protein [Paenibacillus sp. RC67]|uniref:immunoglobulin-like domain-containing protein n=1 Tax=Paenibacillus sp. RC67 TaxID=3039392 RepID=UPI0024AC939F|nr:immunoglobulin-like domain-containing protein [Paenibacillus sp. RC67]